FVTVLRGGAIGAEVSSRRISGEAPLMTTFKLDLFDREDQRALGDVIWETSSDQGGTWESYVPDPRYKLSRTQTFEKGTYWVRARMKNRNSGAESSTEIVEVVAYDKPELDLVGPTTLFIGGEGEYRAELSFGGDPIASDDLVIEWSTDGGETFVEKGPKLTLQRDSADRVRLEVRARTPMAPAEDRYA